MAFLTDFCSCSLMPHILKSGAAFNLSLDLSYPVAMVVILLWLICHLLLLFLWLLFKAKLLFR